MLCILHYHFGAGGAQEAKMAQQGQLTQTDQKDVSHHVMSYSAIKLGKRRMNRGMFRVIMFFFFFSKKLLCMMSSAFLEMADCHPKGPEQVWKMDPCKPNEVLQGQL